MPSARGQSRSRGNDPCGGRIVPSQSHTNAGKLYYGYSAYDPRRVAQYLEIFRVYTNYIKTDAKGVTPAMRFGLARGPVKFEDILYFWPWK